MDYILAVGVVFPIVAVGIPATRRMLRLMYEMTCTLITWPFM